MALWSAVLLAVLKAMGQNAHLWKTWQCRSWMWLFSKAKVKWTTPQWMHLDDRGGAGGTGTSDQEVVLEEEGWRTEREPSQGPPLPYAFGLEGVRCACCRQAQCSYPGPPKPKTLLVEKGKESPPLTGQRIFFCKPKT